jgi:hypothetical protein
MLSQYLDQKTGCMVPLMGYMFLLFGIVMLVVGGFNILGAQSSSSWPTTEGEVLTSVVEKKRSSSNRKKSRPVRISTGPVGISVGEPSKGYTYEAVVTYSYSVAGDDHVGKRIAFGAITKGGRERAEATCERYPVGSQVQVYYDPDDAGSATLEVGIQGQVFFIPGLGAVFLLVGALILVIRRMRSAAEVQE